MASKKKKAGKKKKPSRKPKVLGMRVVSTPGGKRFRVIPNSGFSNSCYPIAVMQILWHLSHVPDDVIIELTNGEITPVIWDVVQCIREATVNNSAGHDTLADLSSNIDDELYSFEDLVHNSSGLILTKPMWDAIMRCVDGYFDGWAMTIACEVHGLDGLVIVKVNSEGVLVPADGSSTSLEDAKFLIMHDGNAHGQALFPLDMVAVSLVEDFWN